MTGTWYSPANVQAEPEHYQPSAGTGGHLLQHPRLDHATLGNRKWAWAAGCWREWSDAQANWLPSAPPPAEAVFFNYREHMLGSRA